MTEIGFQPDKLDRSTDDIEADILKDGEDKTEQKEKRNVDEISMEESVSKKRKVDEPSSRYSAIAPVKQEFIISAENRYDGQGSGAEKQRGQNKARKFAVIRDAVQLCPSVIRGDKCAYENCRFEHNLTEYLRQKKTDLDGLCPVWDAQGDCTFRCRFLHSHFQEGKIVKDEERIRNALKEQNLVAKDRQISLRKKQISLPRSKVFEKYLDESTSNDYTESPPRPEEKRTLNLERKMILAPLTTVGNLPFRRLCRDLGADVTYSEMAVSLPLLQGSQSEWALPRAHQSESTYGVQVCASKPAQAIRTCEVLASFCERLDFIDLNCGCPIDLVYKSGAGSGLLDAPGKLIKMLKGMSYAAGSIPITAKIRMGVKDSNPIAKKVISRLVRETDVAAITLHGRSRQQRYTKNADWSYIAECASMVKQMREDEDRKVWFIGNGDCYSWQDWHNEINEKGVDSVMVARGALIKPWIFEEIEKCQDIDKSASERLEYVKKFVNYGLEHWGSDEHGLNATRRFLCEYLSFSHRYVPIGILERLPAKMNERPPRWRGRNDLETLLGSGDSNDWVKISEMFLGPTPKEWSFVPKHKSSSYEIEAEG